MSSKSNHRWGLLFALAVLCVLVAGTRTPAARADAPCEGTVQVTATATGLVAGFVGSELNADGEYVVANAPATSLIVSEGTDGNLVAVNGSDATYPYFGGIQGFYNTGTDLAAGSYNYSYLGATAQTPAAAPPTADGGNSFSDATGIPEAIESPLWTVAGDESLTPTWINSDSTAAPTHLVEIEGVLVITGDPAALAKELGEPTTNVSLTLIASGGACDTLTLHDIPDSIDARATSPAGAAVSYATPTAMLNGASATSARVGCRPASGSTFPVGETTVTCTGTDANASNSPVTASFTVTVSDLQISNVPADITTPATSVSGARVNYTTPTATGGAGTTPAPTVSCTPAPGSTFPIGVSTVNCTATDADDVNSPASATFTVTILNDQLALSNVPANIATPVTGPDGAVVTYTAPTATDRAGGSVTPTVSCVPASGSTFAAGTTTVTCTATDIDDFNSPVSTTFSVSVGAVPQNQAAPQIGGAAIAGDTLTCSTGGWSDFPTSYEYQWNRNGTPIAGATGSSYTVATADQATTLTCAVTAVNAVGSGPSVPSSGVAVLAPAVATCPPARGVLSGDHLGPVTLGLTRSQARHAFAPSSARGRRYEDFFCLTPIGIRVGYASPRLVSRVPATRRRGLRGRIVWISTANASYALNGVQPGATVTSASSHLQLGTPFKIGRNTWYLIPRGAATGVLKTRDGIVEEVGIATRSLTRSRSMDRSLLTSFS